MVTITPTQKKDTTMTALLTQDEIVTMIRDIKTARFSSRDGILTITGMSNPPDLSAVPENFHRQIITGVNAMKYLAGTRKKMTLPEAMRSLARDPHPIITPGIHVVDPEKGEWVPSLYIEDPDTGDTIEIEGPQPVMTVIRHSRAGLVEYVRRTHRGYLMTALS